MEFIVDKLPNHPSECDLHYPDYKIENLYRCRMCTHGDFICKIGNKGFQCPYLKEFEAEVVEEIPTLGNSICKITPVRLKD